MTKQDVVFCKTVFEKIKYNFDEQEIWPSENYYRNLSSIKIKTLKTNKKLLERCIKESKGFLKIFKQHLFGTGLEFVDSENAKNFVNDTSLNTLCNISEKTSDKIIHSENRRFYKELKESEFKDNFEILGIDGFISPPANSKLLAAIRKIELKKGSKFIFTEVLRPYFKETSKLIVYDRYLRKRNRGFSNLIRILELCENLSICEIHTLNKKNDDKNNFDIELEQFEMELIQKFGKRIKVLSDTQHRRKIITDDFEIRIDPGLDFVNNDFICENNDVDIQIEKIEQ